MTDILSQDLTNSPPIPVTAVRWVYLVVGVLLFLAMGLVYAWSIFVPPLAKDFGWQPNQTGLGFTILMSMFCLGGVVTGLITKRWTPRLAIWICGVLIGLGFFGASRLNSLGELYFFFSGLVGLGVGMAYNAVLSSVLRWFPERQGLISGILMMGFGLGSLILSTVGTSMLESIGWRATFLTLAGVYAVLVLVSSFFIVYPGPGVVFPAAATRQSREEGLELDTGRMVRRPTFWFIFIWATLLSAGGLMVIGSAASIAESLGADVRLAGFLTGLIAISNGCGRVLAGLLYDKVGRKLVMPLLSAGFIVTGAVLLAALATGSLTLLVAGFILTGLSYGGVPPSNSTLVSSFYGLKNYSLNFSIINLNIMAASFLGPALAGIMQTMSGAYNTTFIAIVVFGVLSLGLMFLVRKP